MAITLADLPELVRLLEQHPEWREALRLVLLGEELLTMPQLLRQVIETQHQLVEQVAEIVAVQQRHEQQLAEIIRVQHRHEEQIAELIRVQHQILETQQRHEQQIAELIATQHHHSRLLTEILEVQRRHTQEIQELRSYVGSLTQSLGLSIEENAEDMLLYVMEKKGWKLVQGPNSISTDGELDLIAVFEDATGQQHTVLMEVKMRLSRSAVEQWSDRMRSEGFLNRLRAQGFEPPYHPYLFGFRVDVTAEEAARARMVGLITSRGELVEPEVIS